MAWVLQVSSSRCDHLFCAQMIHILHMCHTQQLADWRIPLQGDALLQCRLSTGNLWIPTDFRGILHITGADPQRPVPWDFPVATLQVPNIILLYSQGSILILCVYISNNVPVGQWCHACGSRMWTEGKLADLFPSQHHLPVTPLAGLLTVWVCCEFI